mmetsp:Transcript_17116/g.64855  ORF Transcript_17116/g.64855 Transcript_17116/m.64855 type:complete len:210 (+) Transcript_17116:349-978(+)
MSASWRWPGRTRTTPHPAPPEPGTLWFRQQRLQPAGRCAPASAGPLRLPQTVRCRPWSPSMLKRRRSRTFRRFNSDVGKSTVGTTARTPTSTAWTTSSCASTLCVTFGACRHSGSTKLLASCALPLARRSTATWSARSACSKSMVGSTRSTAKTCACWPSSSSITRLCTSTWTRSTSTFYARRTKRAHTSWGTSPRRSTRPRASTSRAS